MSQGTTDEPEASARVPFPMRKTTAALALAVTLLLPSAPAAAQGIVVDEGTFRITIRGRDPGTEQFSIRQAGIGRDDAFFANGVITLGSDADREEVSPLLRASPPGGLLVGYQVKVTGKDRLDLQMSLIGNRYVAVARSTRGDEEREFPSRANTRLLERFVAHHYYFLRDAREGDEIHVIEPRTRTHTTLTVDRRTDEAMQLAGRTTEARRIDVTVGGEARSIWYDRLGRVLRVRIESAGYVAERTDLVG